jgi:hypothetical protein
LEVHSLEAPAPMETKLEMAAPAPPSELPAEWVLCDPSVVLADVKFNVCDRNGLPLNKIVWRKHGTRNTGRSRTRNIYMSSPQFASIKQDKLRAFVNRIQEAKISAWISWSDNYPSLPVDLGVFKNLFVLRCGTAFHQSLGNINRSAELKCKVYLRRFNESYTAFEVLIQQEVTVVFVDSHLKGKKKNVGAVCLTPMTTE